MRSYYFKNFITVAVLVLLSFFILSASFVLVGRNYALRERRETIVVPDVEAFPGHIACSSLSRSEIVVPILQGGDVVAVLDIDSRELATFDEQDASGLEALAQLIAGQF